MAQLARKSTSFIFIFLYFSFTVLGARKKPFDNPLYLSLGAGLGTCQLEVKSLFGQLVLPCVDHVNPNIIKIHLAQRWAIAGPSSCPHCGSDHWWLWSGSVPSHAVAQRLPSLSNRGKTSW